MIVQMFAREEQPPDQNVFEQHTGLFVGIGLVLIIIVVGFFVWRARNSKQRAASSRDDSSAPEVASATPVSQTEQPPIHTAEPNGAESLHAPQAAAPPAPVSSDTATPVGVFISYRRNDAPHLAGRLFDRLREHFGDGRIFMDVDSIEPGLDFGEVIADAVRSSKVMLVIIGPNWLSSQDGSRRIDSPDDYVRIELDQALQRGIRVIPVLVDGSTMPSSTDLPDELQSLARRNAVEITHRAFTTDADRLIELTDRLLAK